MDASRVLSCPVRLLVAVAARRYNRAPSVHLVVATSSRAAFRVRGQITLAVSSPICPARVQQVPDWVPYALPIPLIPLRALKSRLDSQ